MKRNWIPLFRWSILLYIFPVISFITKDNANNSGNQHRFPFCALLTPFPVIAFINEEAVVSKLHQWRSHKFYQWNIHSSIISSKKSTLLFFISCYTLSLALSMIRPDFCRGYTILIILYVSSLEINKSNPSCLLSPFFQVYLRQTKLPELLT